ncbi:MAG: N-acetyltransferase [Betaproteobacteria bacterium]|nr:N-acetyltransferase [Betaproteobacteria bacterium]
MNDLITTDILETPRMWLRCPYPGDGEALYRGVSESLEQLRQWPDSLPWAQNPQSARASEDYCQTAYAAWVMGLAWPLLMVDKATEQLVGSVAFHQKNHGTPVWELGYWCRTSYQGQGRMSEAVRSLTRAAHTLVPDAQLVCRVDQRNLASIQVMAKTGFVWVKNESLSNELGQTHVVRQYRWAREAQTGQSA